MDPHHLSTQEPATGTDLDGPSSDHRAVQEGALPAVFLFEPKEITEAARGPGMKCRCREQMPNEVARHVRSLGDRRPEVQDSTARPPADAAAPRGHGRSGSPLHCTAAGQLSTRRADGERRLLPWAWERTPKKRGEARLAQVIVDRSWRRPTDLYLAPSRHRWQHEELFIDASSHAS